MVVDGGHLQGVRRGDLGGLVFLLAVGIGPVGNQLRGGRRHAKVTALALHGDAAADVVDELVLLDAVLCPFRLELKLLGPLLLWLGDGDEIGTGPAAVNNLAGDALVAKSEMAGRLVERRVDDRVFDDDLTHIQ